MQSGMRWLRWGASLLVLFVLVWVFRDELDFLSEGFRRLKDANAFAVVVVILASVASLVTMSGVMQQLIIAAWSSGVAERSNGNLLCFQCVVHYPASRACCSPRC